MSLYLYATLIEARTTAVIYPADTSFDIDDASKLPTLGSGQYFVIEMMQGPAKEIMYCTAVSSNTLTVTRAQEDTDAVKFLSNALCIVKIDPTGFSLSLGNDTTSVQQAMAITSLRV